MLRGVSLAGPDILLPFFRHLLRYVNAGVVAVLDGAHLHRAKTQSVFARQQHRLAARYLPLEAPGFSSASGRAPWSSIKGCVLGNFC